MPAMRPLKRPFIPAGIAVALVTGCGPLAPSDGYPREWPAPQPSYQASGCPDLAGRYATGDGVLARTFLHRARLDAPAVDWRSLQIEDTGSGSYRLELHGRTLADGESIRQQLGPVGFRCREGWARYELPHGTHDPIARAPEDDRRVERYLLMARDRDGNLVAQEVIERVAVISVWAETGAGIPIPFTHSSDRQWSRWLAWHAELDAPPRQHLLAGHADAGLRALGRLLPADAEILTRRTDADGHTLEVRLPTLAAWMAVEEQLRSSDSDHAFEATGRRQSSRGPVTVTLHVGPGRIVPSADTAPVAARRAEQERNDAVARRLRAQMPRGGSLSGVRADDDGYLVEASFPDADALSTFVTTLMQSPEFGIPEVRSTRPAGGKAVYASVWVRLR